MVVLVGVDGSAGSRAALQFAFGFAQRMEARLCAVWSWEYPAAEPLTGGPPLLAPDETDAVVDAHLVEVLREEFGEAAASVGRRVERGPADYGLFHAVTQTGAEVLIVGQRGLGAVAGRLLGSVSRRVAEQAPCPVIVVPAGCTPGSGPIVVGVDGSVGAAGAVRWATAVAKADRVGIVAVHAMTPVTGELAAMAVEHVHRHGRAVVDGQCQPVVEAGIELRVRVVVSDPRMLLEEVATGEDARLVVVGARGTGPIGALLLGSVSAYMVQHCNRPIAVIPSSRR